MKKCLFISLIFAHGASLYAEDNNSLLVAAREGDIEKLTTIFAEKEKPQGWIVDLACREGFQAGRSKEVMETLLAHNTTKEETLMWACGRGDSFAVIMLLENGTIAHQKHQEEAHLHGYTELAALIAKNLSR